MKKHLQLLVVFLILFTGLFSCSNPQQKKEEKKDSAKQVSTVSHPDWAKSACIYEVNVRQYTPEGTFKAFQKHLPRLKEMGVDIVWLMPINPIGLKNRKGKLGSYYSVKDYLDVNPEFGNMKDFKALVEEVHKLGMRILIDWVPNHSSWDNKLITEHPDWYQKDKAGKIISYSDWTDVALFDYKNPDMRRYMTDAMKFWIKDVGIDGLRCDVAWNIPVDYWDAATAELRQIKPIMMLAEAEIPALLKNAFDADYAWNFLHATEDLAKGKKDVSNLDSYFANIDTLAPQGAMKMYFTSNHDENSWNGTEFERYKDGFQAMAVLCFTVPGIPLIYNGQEAGMNKRLRFFERDTINWKDLKYADFYTKLLKLKKANKALWNPPFGGSYTRLKTNNDKKIMAYLREKDDNALVVVINLSGDAIDAEVQFSNPIGDVTEVFANERSKLGEKAGIKLKAWEYKVFAK